MCLVTCVVCLSMAMKVRCVLSVDGGVVCLVMKMWCVLSDGERV